MSLSYPGFLLKGGTIYDLIRLHSLWELSPLLPVPPLGHIIILMHVLFCLHSRWESSPLPPDQPLGQNITCMTSSAVTAIGSFLLFRLIHRWVAQVLYNLIDFHSCWEFPPLPPIPQLGCTKAALADSVPGPHGTL